jgi:hypothetical protein
LDEYVAILMEAIKSCLNSAKIIARDAVLSDEVTKVHESREAFNHVRGQVACNSTEVDLESAVSGAS